MDVLERVQFGAAYYYEYESAPRLDRDLDQMVAAGFTLIRVGESVWSTWEPTDGVCDLEWLSPVLDGAYERGIRVLLGTPTYAVPPWLQLAHPEIAVRRADGRSVPWGARQEVDFTHPVFRRFAERVIRKIIGRYGDHPAVIGVQLDNEPGLHLIHNDHVVARFVDRLRSRYGSVEELNRAWGLTYWSHRLSSWEELWSPSGNTTPSYDLAWRRYQADLTTEFIGWQADIVAAEMPRDRFVTTCIAYNRPALDDVALGRRLGISSGNAYYQVQDALELDGTRPTVASEWFARSAGQLFQLADRMYATKQQNYLVTETNATSIAGSHINQPAYDGQLRQAAWALVARGASSIGYWHWHTLPYGAETYWGGVIGHDHEPARIYREVARIGRELGAAGGQLARLRPDADVGFVTSAESKWAMECQPPLATPDGDFPDRRSYERVVDAFYRGTVDAGLQAGFLAEVDLLQEADLEALVQRFPVLVTPALYVADDALLDRLADYAVAGGHLIMTLRTGYVDTEARARQEPAPPRMVEVSGIRYREYSTITGQVGLQGSDLLPLEPDASASGWVDGVEVIEPSEGEAASVLATYDHPHFGRFAAVTRRSYGKGQVSYVGTLPNPAAARALFGSIERQSRHRWPALPRTVTVRSARNAAGERIWFVHNWSWDSTTVRATAQLRDVTDPSLPAADSFVLGAWDARVLA